MLLSELKHLMGDLKTLAAIFSVDHSEHVVLRALLSLLVEAFHSPIKVDTPIPTVLQFAQKHAIAVREMVKSVITCPFNYFTEKTARGGVAQGLRGLGAFRQGCFEQAGFLADQQRGAWLRAGRDLRAHAHGG